MHAPFHLYSILCFNSIFTLFFIALNPYLLNIANQHHPISIFLLSHCSFFLSLSFSFSLFSRLRRADQRWQQRKLRLLWGSPRYISGRGHWLVSRFLHLPLWHYESFWNARGWRNWGGSGGCWWRVTDWRGSGPKDMCYFRPSQSIVVFSTAIVTEAFYLRRTCSFDDLIFS